MSTVRISLEALRDAAGKRPPGYVADVVAKAREVTGTHAVLASSVYAALTAKYRTGPGTELKALLSKIGIVAKLNCSCNKRAKIMDEKGCDWCEQNIDEIDGWLAEEARKRNLPYISLAGKTLIRLAIRRARKKGNSK